MGEDIVYVVVIDGVPLYVCEELSIAENIVGSREGIFAVEVTK